MPYKLSKTLRTTLPSLCLVLGLMLIVEEAGAQLVDVRLSCDSTLVTNYPSGRKIEQKQRVLVSISEESGGNGYLYIALDSSERIATLSTAVTPQKRRVRNTTNQARWGIYAESEDEPGYPLIVEEVIIDRQEGTLRYRTEFRGGSKSIAGACERVDNKPNKF